MGVAVRAPRAPYAVGRRARKPVRRVAVVRQRDVTAATGTVACDPRRNSLSRARLGSTGRFAVGTARLGRKSVGLTVKRFDVVTSDSVRRSLTKFG